MRIFFRRIEHRAYLLQLTVRSTSANDWRQQLYGDDGGDEATRTIKDRRCFRPDESLSLPLVAALLCSRPLRTPSRKRCKAYTESVFWCVVFLSRCVPACYQPDRHASSKLLHLTSQRCNLATLQILHSSCLSAIATSEAIPTMTTSYWPIICQSLPLHCK